MGQAASLSKEDSSLLMGDKDFLWKTVSKSKAQEELALRTKEIYQAKLDANGFGEIVTEILPVSEEFYAEDYHQQYLAKNPNGYCGHGGCGVRFKD